MTPPKRRAPRPRSPRSTPAPLPEPVPPPQPAPAPAVTGVRCPDCGCPHLPALYTRRSGRRTYRTRRCRHCGRLIRTQEMIVGPPSAP